MKLDIKDDIYIIYLKGYYNNDLKQMCLYAAELMDKYYKIKIKGFFDATIYYDRRYGNIIELKRDDINNYYDYSKLDFHIINIEEKFLFEIDDIFYTKLKYFYLYDDKYYIELRDNYNEFYKIKYKNTDKIRNNKIVIDN